MRAVLAKTDGDLEVRGFVGVPQLSPFADWDYYYMRAPLKWFDDDPSSNLQPVTVTTGFVCDLASIPRLFWSVLPKTARYTAPAIIHDYLYWFQPASHTRLQADAVFSAGMRDLGVATWKRWLIHTMVRLAGWMSWNKNRAAKNAGEKRTLRKLPTEINVTWKQWQKDQSVFM